MIEAHNLTKTFKDKKRGVITAVENVSFTCRPGQIYGLLGANGAGKTTTLKAITGTQPAADGEIRFMGHSIKGQGAWDLVKQGLVMVPEGRGIFGELTREWRIFPVAFIGRDYIHMRHQQDRFFAARFCRWPTGDQCLRAVMVFDDNIGDTRFAELGCQQRCQPAKFCCPAFDGRDFDNLCEEITFRLTASGFRTNRLRRHTSQQSRRHR